MARLVELKWGCYHFRCDEEATCEVFDIWNTSHGKFCQVHGEAAKRFLGDCELQDPPRKVVSVEAMGDGG